MDFLGHDAAPDEADKKQAWEGRTLGLEGPVGRPFLSLSRRERWRVYFETALVSKVPCLAWPATSLRAEYRLNGCDPCLKQHDLSLSVRVRRGTFGLCLPSFDWSLRPVLGDCGCKAARPCLRVPLFQGQLPIKAGELGDRLECVVRRSELERERFDVDLAFEFCQTRTSEEWVCLALTAISSRQELVT